jgi:hypothetical protein
MMTDYELDGGCWKKSFVDVDKDGNEVTGWIPCLVTDVPVTVLLEEWEDLVLELSQKEVELSIKKEEYANKEFEIVFMSDINFKKLYDSTAEKVRKQHAKTVLSELDKEINALELGIAWIRQYIPLLKEVIRVKQ